MAQAEEIKQEARDARRGGSPTCMPRWPRARLTRPSRWAKRRHLVAVEPHTNQDMTDVVHVLTTDLLRPDQPRAR